MAEGVIYEGMGRPKAGPVEWVKQKLRERYTTKGRMEKEFRILEKTMGPLTDQQRAEVAARIGDKIHNKVVGNVVKDAISAALVVTTGGVLIAKPELRAKLATKLGTASMEAGQYMSKNFAAAAAKLRTVSNEGDKVGFFKRMLAGMAEGAQKTTAATSSRATEFFARRTGGAIHQTVDRAVKAETSFLKSLDKIDKYAPNAIIPEKVKKTHDALRLKLSRRKTTQFEVINDNRDALMNMAENFRERKIADRAAKLAKEAAKIARKVVAPPKP